MKKRKRGDSREAHLRLRILLVLGLFLFFFAAILARAFELQVLKGTDLKRMAEGQHSTTITVQSRRGDIFDRNMKELAVSIEVDSVYAQPSRVSSPERSARMLSPVLRMPAPEIERKLRSSRKFVWIKRQVDLGDKERELISGMDGVGMVKESRRYYPNRHLAANLIGFTGLDSNGLEGVELFYDGVLKGASRKVIGERDARGRVLLYEDVDKKVPLEGMVVELTIDKTIQYIAEKALRKAVKDSGARAGSALVMDPFTGEVLAMANYPTFDPNDHSRYGPTDWRNRSVTDVFEPGSTFKLFLIAAALDENIIKPTEAVYCENGSYRVADRVFHDTKKHGWLTVPQILKYSSNIGSAKIGERLGKEDLYRYLASFGFGVKTGVDLPGEAAGVLRHSSKWSAVTIDTVSFGQGVSATSMQLLTALSAIANGGFLMKPYMVKSVRAADGSIVSEYHPVVVRRVISEATARKVTEMLIGVTRADGTGAKASLEGFEVAGKTGTAQKPDLRNGGYLDGAYISSFFGYVPARDPRLAILVVVDEPEGLIYYGGDVAAPAFREIASQGLSYLGIFPGRDASPGIRLVKAGADASREDALGVYTGASGSRPGTVPDFTGKSVRMVMRMAKSMGMDVETIGTGRAVSQRPAPGWTMPGKGTVTVWFK